MSEEVQDRKDLKIQALLEKISLLTTQYENQVADLRVDLTIDRDTSARAINLLNDKIKELEGKKNGSSEEEEEYTSNKSD